MPKTLNAYPAYLERAVRSNVMTVKDIKFALHVGSAPDRYYRRRKTINEVQRLLLIKQT